MKYFLYLLLILGCLISLVLVFWHQELKYQLPTEIPSEFQDVPSGAKLDMEKLAFLESNDRPSFVHFYNHECPCSRFNATEFKQMVLKYKDKANFYAVLEIEEEESNEVAKFQRKYDLGIPIYIDHTGEIAKSLGVYATPQAVIISTDSTLYYKGNYNRARYCVSRNTKFAEMALESFLNNEPAPIFGSLATVAYGCSLPANSENDNDLFQFIF